MGETFVPVRGCEVELEARRGVSIRHSRIS